MWWTVGKTVLKVYAVLWMTAVGGILGANLLAIIGMLFFVPENKGVYVQPWAHAGWYIGTALFFIGAISGRLRFINGTGLGDRRKQIARDSAVRDGEVAKHAEQSQPKEESGILKCIVGFGLAGGICGFLLGASLLVFWFSLAYSPFTSQQVASSVEVVQEREAGSVVRRNVMRSDHPIALYLCLIPVGLGVAVGATAGGIIGLRYGDDERS